jgi:ABC-type sugar transport system ATPase subunit
LSAVELRSVVKRHGSFIALKNIDLEIQPGEFFALLGPSGSGKTTTLRLIAGLDTADEGRIILGGQDQTRAEPGERDVAMVFQSYALYPHMSVHDNIAFPLRMVGTAPAEIERAVREAAERVSIGHLLARRPGQLSGGQQQRCALARAIVRKPRLFLLDEPLSNLDAKLRMETRVELKKLHRSLGVTTVYVTHDQEEAMTIADRMAVFMEGRIEQIGTPDEVFAQPKTLDVAAFLGSPPMNFFPARIDGRTAHAAGQAIPLPREYGSVPDAVLGIRPGAIRLEQSGIPARVYLVEQLGESAIADLHVGDTLVRARIDRKLRLNEGDTVHLAFSPEDIHVFDTATGRRL